MLDLPDYPIVYLADTLAMKTSALSVGGEYIFRHYDLYYNKELTGKRYHSFIYDRGNSFSEIGKTGKERFYIAQ